ncbi:acyl-CoA dehydrogenase family protein [Streptomyces sp. ISL-94]|uniref:acyl-CoA dehydrogenase family protein n=1 Tax=Streptomyces sp. ISL-94 TaxID=2819190 RepID=UPI001BEBAB20|nr:acyl-CoA dehydrogenase family protein [Streptomyces sp. ISL-94]MBT2479788.1 acyl-CoA dehydrogenase family protein [Streptomyces sp. ISL-94]
MTTALAPTAVPDTAEAILAHARTLVPVLREASARIEENRRLPADIVALLRDGGVFRAAMPKTWGGPELTSMQQCELIETIATGDPSTAWCAMIGMGSGIYSGYLDDSVAREMYPGLDLANSGWIYPQGRAVRVEGGYRLTGRWKFGSGSSHCDWLGAGCLVVDENGTPEADPLTGADTHWRVMIARPTEYTFHDTWHTTGLAGSGSQDYSCEDLFVPAERSFSFGDPKRTGPLHNSPDAILRKMPGIPLGMARAALDHVREMAAHRTDRETGTPWAQDLRIQSTIARLEGELTAARAGVYTTLTTQWNALSGGTELTDDARVATAIARHHAFRTARHIVQTLFDLVGGSSVYKPSPMDRWLRDAYTMNQHAVAQDSILQLTGNVLLGGTSTSPFF